MKAIRFAIAALCLVPPIASAQRLQWVYPPRLAGMVSLADRQCAALMLAALGNSRAEWLVLSEEQRDGDIEVTRIAPDKGSVELWWQGTNSATVRLHNATNLPVPGVILEDVPLDVVLRLFAQFTNRSLLRWPVLPATSFDLRASAKDQAGAAKVLEQALVAKGLSIIPDGEKFLMIVPMSEAAKAKPHAPATKPATGSGSKQQAAPPGSGGGVQEVIPPGMIDFRGADVSQVASIYSALVGRKLDLSERPLLNGTISFLTQTRLTKEEAVYALETLLRWRGIKLVPAGEDQLKPVRVDED